MGRLDDLEHISVCLERYLEMLYNLSGVDTQDRGSALCLQSERRRKRRSCAKSRSKPQIGQE